MRVRSSSGLMAVAVLALLLPSGAVAQSGQLEADNPANTCSEPLTETIVSGDLGSTVVVEKSAEIDLVTLETGGGGAVVDVDWDDEGDTATITATKAVDTYVVWSCAPMNGEPVQRNDGQDV